MKTQYPTISAGLLTALCVLLGLACAVAPLRAQNRPTETVEALLYSTMPSTTAHRPEMALDGDKNTYYRTVYGMSDGDEFRILLSRPIPLASLRIVTGDPEGQDTLTDASVETSPDNSRFRKAAAFDATGIAAANLDNSPILALRIRLNRGRGIPALLLREITLQSTVPIAHVQAGPGRGFVDLSQAPDLAEWAARAEAQMESFWADTAALLYTDRFITPNMVNVVYRTGPGVTDVAATGGGVMTVNTKWCRQHPEDTGLAVHEMAHVIQSCSAYDPVWLVEGIADYIRWVRFEPENYRTRLNPRTATFHDSYRTTASFLGWCELHYDSRLVTKLNHDVRFGTYKPALFKQYCGKDVDTLWAEFLAAYQKDPLTLLTPPVPPADRPRPLPAVKPGTGIPVDLSGAYNSLGLAANGSTFPPDSGFDNGGAAYSAMLLGPTLTWKDVPFRLGPPNARDLITAQGAVLPLPRGAYASLWLLGAAVEGNQKAQTLTLTYTDGTQETLLQNFSDWFVPQSFPGESRALKMPYRNMANGAKDPRPFFVYSYGFPINSAKTVQSLTLPNNPNIKILAITLAN